SEIFCCIPPKPKLVYRTEEVMLAKSASLALTLALAAQPVDLSKSATLSSLAHMQNVLGLVSVPLSKFLTPIITICTELSSGLPFMVSLYFLPASGCSYILEYAICASPLFLFRADFKVSNSSKERSISFSNGHTPRLSEVPGGVIF